MIFSHNHQHVPFYRFSRKDLENFPPVYNNQAVEEGWYAWWKEKDLFGPQPETRQRKPGEKAKFSMVLPPPNVTGVLHLGHALTTSVQVGYKKYLYICKLTRRI